MIQKARWGGIDAYEETLFGLPKVAAEAGYSLIADPNQTYTDQREGYLIVTTNELKQKP